MAAANKVVQCCMLRARMLLSMAAPSVAALGASQVRAHPPASHPCTLMHMPSLHRCHRVLAGGCTEATRRARWAHCPRRAAVSPHSARGAHSCHAARRGISGRFGLSRAVCAPRAAMGMLAHCDRSAACLPIPHAAPLHRPISPIAGAGQEPILAAYSAGVRAHDAVT